MAMRIDEAGHYNMSRRVDDGGVGRVNPGGDLRDFRSVDEHVANRVIADAVVHRQDRPALDEEAPTLDADTLGHRGRRRAVSGFEIDRGGPQQARFDCECGETRGGVRADSRRGDLTDLAHASLPGSAPP